MSAPNRIGLLGFGEVGQILGVDLPVRAMNHLAFDVKFRQSDSAVLKAVRASDNVERCSDPIELGRRCDLIISAVTAERTEEAAQSVSSDLCPNSWFLDLNSASPEAKSNTANIINRAGGRYVEASVMSPVPPKRLATPILIGGPHAAEFAEIGAAMGLTHVSVFSDVYGKAAAAKMCRSVMIKGIEALLSESLIAARAYGVEDTVLQSLDDLFPGPDWRELAKYMIERTLLHGGRRAEEMREVAKTVSGMGLDADMSLATVARQDWAKVHPEILSLGSLDTMLDALVEIANERSSEAKRDVAV